MHPEHEIGTYCPQTLHFGASTRDYQSLQLQKKKNPYITASDCHAGSRHFRQVSVPAPLAIYVAATFGKRLGNGQQNSAYARARRACCSAGMNRERKKLEV